MVLLFYLHAAEGASAFDVESLDGIGRLEVALALDPCERGLYDGLHANIPANTDFHSAKTAVDVDDGPINDVGIAKVESGKSL